MHRQRELPLFVIYFLGLVVIILLLVNICFGAYHICYLGHNILTDDLDDHLVATPTQDYENYHRHSDVMITHGHALPVVSAGKESSARNYNVPTTIV